MEGLLTPSSEGVLTDRRRGDIPKGARPEEGQFSLCVFKGEKVQERMFRSIPRILPLATLPESWSGRALIPMVRECRTVGSGGGGLGGVWCGVGIQIDTSAIQAPRLSNGVILD